MHGMDYTDYCMPGLTSQNLVLLGMGSCSWRWVAARREMAAWHSGHRQLGSRRRISSEAADRARQAGWYHCATVQVGTVRQLLVRGSPEDSGRTR